MKALNTDAVRKLYRGKYNPAAESHEENHAEIGFLAFRIAAALAMTAAVSPREIRATIDHVVDDTEKLRDLEREDAFIKGFRCAVELLGKGDVKNAER